MNDLTTPHFADACLRLGVPLRLAPAGITAVVPGHRIAGPAVPVRHAGSVDIFIEAIHGAPAGSILVIDNEGRTDEGCIGDLTALEAKAAGLAGIVVWGLHRDTAELVEVGLPVFSYGRFPAGPRRAAYEPSRMVTEIDFGGVRVSGEDFVVADADGVLFLPAADLDSIERTARTIATREREQAAAVARGTTLYEQLQFERYVSRRAEDPSHTFRHHLRDIAGAIEE